MPLFWVLSLPLRGSSRICQTYAYGYNQKENRFIR